jgi:hypothetical protein
MLIIVAACSSQIDNNTIQPMNTTAPPQTVETRTAVPSQETAKATPSPMQIVPTSKMDDFYYGIAQLVDNPNDFRSPEILAEQMQQIKALGVNAILQAFPPELTAADWQMYLDLAQQEELVIIGKIGPVSWNPNPEDLSPILDLLSVVSKHPALYGFFYLHEPWELYANDQIQTMYREIKAIHPYLRLGVGLSGGIGKYNTRNRKFADEICDICFVNLKSFQNDPQKSESQGVVRLDQAAAIIQRVDPDAELWSSTQIWAPPGGGQRGFRIPSPEEMETLFCKLKQTYPLQGFFWEVWTFDKPTEGALSEPEAAEKREAVREIHERCVLNP